MALSDSETGAVIKGMNVQRTLARVLAVATSATAMLFAAGFVYFANQVSSYPNTAKVPADGIVVLTGGVSRIDDAIMLLREGRAPRLLISGVNPSVSTAVLKRRVAQSAQLFDCCIDLGREARNTVENAAEARAWLDKHRFATVILVTSNYHMPRSMLEFAHAAPDVTLIPHAVTANAVAPREWWRHPATGRLLLGEYTKYLYALARIWIDRINPA